MTDYAVGRTLGYDGSGVYVVAPLATVIPVKVLGQNGSGWWSVISRGIVYVANLKAEGGELHDFPVVINMSLAGSTPSGMEEAAIDYAIEQGVIVVASAGNRGEAGMGYPGAFPKVISAAASGWVDLFTPGSGGWLGNVPDPTDPEYFYIADFSSRAIGDQDLDVTAPGAWVVGPYQVNSGQLSYYYLSGTSMSSPHAAGIVALMLDKNPSLTRDQVEAILEASAIPMPAGCRTVPEPAGSTEYCWSDDATGAGLASAAAALLATP